MAKPSKKATIDQLRTDLANMGLNTQGKKETLFRRLWNAFMRTPSEPSLDEEVQRDARAAASSLQHDGSVLEAGLGEPRKVVRKYGNQPYKSFLCFDVEATCTGGKEFGYPNEVIEFPVVLLQWEDESEEAEEEEDSRGEAGPSSSIRSEEGTKIKRLGKVDVFHSYVRPTWRPVLSDFCTSLTGITQEMVDKSPTFLEVLQKLEGWLNGHDLLDDGYLKNALWVTDGVSASGSSVARSTDAAALGSAMPKQLHITPPPSYPSYLLGPYINLKQAVQTVLTEEWKRAEYARKHPLELPNGRSIARIGTGRLVSRAEREKGTGPNFYGNIESMLGGVGVSGFEGRLHSGIDDATNIARILIALADRDVLLEPNARLPHANNLKKWSWMGKPGEVLWEEWMNDSSVVPELGGATGLEKNVIMVKDGVDRTELAEAEAEVGQGVFAGPSSLNGHLMDRTIERSGNAEIAWGNGADALNNGDLEGIPAAVAVEEVDSDKDNNSPATTTEGTTDRLIERPGSEPSSAQSIFGQKEGDSSLGSTDTRETEQPRNLPVAPG